MSDLFNELKIPALTLTILMAIFAIARANAQYLSDLDSTLQQNALPILVETDFLPCIYKSDEPLLLELPLDDE